MDTYQAMKKSFKGRNRSGKKGSHHSHICHTSHERESEVDVTVTIDRNTITLSLIDKAGNPVDEVEVNPEKLHHY